ncbi:intradiol ring-cleavage dioxygenase [Steroidobacter sp.]|uniref:intradiol ring-cleavage dioxygenase n=1 Tax=Steroidobacter sp. TaxID=1978227 RepID=UPI001A480B0B|nr:intradiol ring-cleavage dioxygenase [Steroidobacter sp.]MBL8272159.1 intradiol ring-cleavage dioxygenase [Steroidobacter sp.]
MTRAPTHQPHLDDHDLGLQHDLEQLAALKRRRRVLGMMLSGSALMIAGCGGGDGDSGTTSTTSTSGSSSSGSSSSGSSSSGSSSSSDTCTEVAEETQGPYPSDGSNTVNGQVSNVLSESGVVRSDIRSSFGGASGVAAGVPTTLTITLLNSNNLCQPLSGYAIYLWHCTRDGNYSLYSSSVQDENFLRGVQVADSNGQVTFTTIFPGCYSGRYPHIHFEIYSSLSMATLYTNKILTSQIALPRDVCSTVYSGATGYSSSVTNLSRVTLASDGIFGDNTAAQLAAMTAAMSGSVADGYTGTLTIGVPA